ncbi:SH3-like domain-containing protein [Pseudomonas syringae]|uniref:Nitrile hydratase beta subunit-like N-terminal domain-containing protein n=1 Tax=Pseudomonas syringae pv. aceris TaxID=199198 RepID=A0A0L8IQ09_PSESX|nr:SH3-like domain-containing protein [Pseudomonas syringae]EGH71496.1 Nitrile hydratase [Pseudomonas syringae pv. aceris str. M302273]KOG03531.1 Nitrile hydratase [Pseudomonas syringae pv. aceris]KPW19561.1 hypothetical protein ALO91_103341 [Pseudomonas syringae pv. aceris]
MNAAHDVGGMHIGPIAIEIDEPVFHEQWEKDVLSFSLLVFMGGFCTVDEFRHWIEKMAPAHYFGTVYYEHWLFSIEKLLVKYDLVTEQEIAQKMAQLSAEVA